MPEEEKEHELEYEYKTTPFKHQEDLFLSSREKEAVGVFWEQGCGKTKPVLDTTCWLFEQSLVDGALIVAPNGVHVNWISDEIPAHVPDRVRRRMRMHYYDSPKAGTKWHQRACEDLLKHDGLAVLAMSYDGFMTERGKNFAWKFLRRRRCIYTLDESHKVKTPGAKRTKSIIASGKYAPYRRILSGTPVGSGPFDVYSQVRFLHPEFWQDRMMGSFAAFKQRYGVWRTAEQVKAELGYDPGYDQLLGYKNLDELERYLRLVGDRKTKDEVLDLPPKLYTKLYVEMTPSQRRAYEDLVAEYRAELEDGTVVEAPLAIVRLLRLQQIACGYVAAEAEEPVVRIGDRNPRLEAVVEYLKELPHPAIVWARFTEDINQLMEALGEGAVRYDGTMSTQEAMRSKEEFQHGDARWFVGNQQKGAEGITLTRARTVLYYSNSFKLIERLQSEDRAHRIGQEHPVSYVDVVCRKTIDEQIVGNLRDKFDVAALLNGDKLREWI